MSNSGMRGSQNWVFNIRFAVHPSSSPADTRAAAGKSKL